MIKYYNQISYGITICVLVVLMIACGPGGETNNNSTEIDSAAITSKRVTDSFESKRRGIEDSVIAEFVRKYPEMQYAYLPTDDGNITTVKGNYQVAVDGIEKRDDLNRFVRYMEQNFENRARRRDKFNKEIDSPARPENGYEAFYNQLEQNIRYPDEEIDATVFVEFIVNEDGELTEVKAVENTYFDRDRKLVSQIGSAAVEAVRATPGEWLPARRNGQPVKMKIEIPIQFPGE